MDQDRNVVTNREDLTRLDGQAVVAIGEYEAVVRPVKGKVTKELPKDHALLHLGDGTRVYLEPLDSKKSRRPKSELMQFNGKRVRVYGTAHTQMPARGASLIAPCLSEISEVREAE